MQHRMPVAGKRADFIGMTRFQFRGQSRKFRMRQSDMQVVDAVKRFMQEREGHQLAGPCVSHDVAGAAVDRIAC